MSNAAAAADAAPPPKSKKMLIIVAAVVLVVLLGGVGAMLMLKKKPAEGDDAEAEQAKPAKAAKAAKSDPKAAPIFAPLDPFVVNLADKDAERYAQVGITLEITDAKLGDEIKTLMPAIRHTVLMLLAEKTASQLIDRRGKERFARQVQRETSRVLGAEVDDEEEEEEDAEAAPAKAKDGKGGTGAKKKKRKPASDLPVRAVHFSSFIVQ
jgi:flagellar FliL protein